MNNSFYKQLIEDSPTGYAYHRIIYDEEGIPCDYEFIEVNSAFEALTGLRGSEIVGRRVTEIQPGIRTSEFDWIHFYGDVAIKGGKKEFEQYSEPLNKWYKVSVYSPEKNYFITHFADMTKEMSQLPAVKNMVALSEEFLQINEQEIDYQRINDDFLNITGAKYAVFNLFDEVEKSSTTMAISGDKGIIKKATSIIGYKTEGNKWERNLESEEKIKTGTITHFPSIKELVDGAIPKPLVVLLEKTLNLGEVILIKILTNNIMIGDFTLIMGKGERFDEDALAELYTRQLGIVITRKQAEEALRSNQRKLTDIIEFLPDATLAIDKEGRVIIWNKAIEKMTGIPSSEMIGKGEYAYTIPFYGEAQSQLMDLVFLYDEEIAARYPNLTREGDTLMAEVFCPALYNNKGAWIFVKASPLHDQSGNIIGAIESIRDITERKQAEDALKESEELFKATFEQAAVGIVHATLDGKFIMVNQKFCDIVGYTQSELLNMSFMDITHPNDLRNDMDNMTKLLNGDFNTFSEEKRYFKKDCTIVWVNLTVSVINQLSGKFTYVMGVVDDITKRKGLETVLSNEKKLIETTLISVGDGVISTDNKCNIVFLNKVAEFLTGWTQEAARGKSIEKIFNIVNEFTQEKGQNIVKKVFESGKILELANHTILISKDGIERPIEDSVAPIVQENGEIVGVVLVFRDFSEKKQKQEEILYLSHHDQLTGLYNRRFYEEELKRLDTKRNLPMTIAMGDVNGLKLINDSFGHVMGDELLKKVAEVIKKGCRADDIIARLGGDEFVIILPKTDAFETEQIIKRIKDLLLKEKVGSIDISISFGLETKNNKKEKVQEVLKKAEDHMYKKKLFESPSMRRETINAIISALHEKNKREEQHSHRVSALCKSMGEALEMPQNRIEELRSVGLLHDIGKIAIEENILNKPGKLTDDEWKEIKLHPEIGYRILSTVNDMAEMAEYVLTHHERWDGKGYPKGLKGYEIPLQSRIITIADAYDAMTSERSYRISLPEEDAIKELQKNAGIQFDPELVSVFIEKVLAS